MHQCSVLIDSKFNFFYYFQCWIYNEYLFLDTFQSWKLLSLESPISIHSSICQSKTLYRLKINNFTLPPPIASSPPFTDFHLLSWLLSFSACSPALNFLLFVSDGWHNVRSIIDESLTKVITSCDGPSTTWPPTAVTTCPCLIFWWLLDTFLRQIISKMLVTFNSIN